MIFQQQRVSPTILCRFYIIDYGGPLKALLKTLEHSPELTLEDLNDIKVPLDLFEIIPMTFCKKFKILPLRLDKAVGIFSFVFVDPQISDELTELSKNQKW